VGAGLFAKLSMTELRARQGVCSGTCNTYHCYKVRTCSTLFFFFLWVTRGGGLPPAGHTQHSQANPTAGGPRQSLTSEIRPMPGPRTAWDSQYLHLASCNSLLHPHHKRLIHQLNAPGVIGYWN
jgi:hypothetical protein